MRLVSPTLRLLAGAGVFALRDRTPGYAYQSLIRLFCLTRGKSNDALAQLISLARPPYALPPTRGVLGDLDERELARIDGTLREKGYYIFDQRLSADLCDRLLHYATTQPCGIRPIDGDSSGTTIGRRVLYSRDNPEAIIYEFEPEDLVNQADIQSLMTDPSILGVAQRYVGARPVLDEVNLWWTTAYGARADANAAQLYHFDMDRIRWLKFFIFLTDVGPENGPHCFVAGSHRSGGIPDHFLARGYSRLPDAEVQAAYPPEKLIEVTGPRGTILAEDTRGLHKGKPVAKGDRLVLEFEFSSSMFGATPLRASHLKVFHTQAFRDWVFAHRRMYDRWLQKA